MDNLVKEAPSHMTLGVTVSLIFDDRCLTTNRTMFGRTIDHTDISKYMNE